jgi:hypothetical protein
MAYPEFAGQERELLRLEGDGHAPVMGHLAYPVVVCRYAAVFLPPVLEEINPLVYIVYAFPGGVNPEYTALVAH